MISKLLWALILTVLPITELRAGLPLAIIYAQENNLSTLFIFLLIVLLNVLLVFFIFLFLDYIHNILLRIKIYEKGFNFYLKLLRKRASKFEDRFGRIGFLALVIFVAIPLPGTGAWTGSVLAWALGLERKKSIAAISLGVIIAGTIIFLATIGTLNFF